MNIAIITARGGSKRIPRKNIKCFCGQPILSYSIQAAKDSNLFDEIMVSTDDEEIAEIARQYGAVVPFLRSEATSNDYATTVDVLFEVLGQYYWFGREYEYACCIYPTAPFVTGNKLVRAFHLLQNSGVDAVIPVVTFSYPPLRGLIRGEKYIQMKWPKYVSARSQDLEPLYHDCGQFYAFRTEALLRERTLFCKATVPMILSELEMQDIDNEVDWELAELKYKLLQKRGLL